MTAGLLLVPNGESLGYYFGDTHGVLMNKNGTLLSSPDVDATDRETITGRHPWGVLFTVLGTVLLDFDADSCQSPARAYLLDVTQPGEQVLEAKHFVVRHFISLL